MSSQFYLIAAGTVLMVSFIMSLLFSRSLFSSLRSELSPDIEVDQMRILEAKIADFIKSANLNDDAAFKDIVKALNVIDCGVGVDIKGRARVYDADPNGFRRVFHNSSVPQEEWTFDLAHECGHLINGDPLPTDRPDGYHKSIIEQMADYTAAAILMPINPVYDFLSRNEYFSATAQERKNIAMTLSKRYEVDDVLVVRRIKEICLLKERNA